jgi:CHAT domain-containing protein
MGPDDKEVALALLKDCDSETAHRLWFRLMPEAMKAQNAGQLPRSIFLYEVAADAVRRFHDDKFLVQSLDWLARAYYSMRDYRSAEASFSEAEVLAEKLNLKSDMSYNLCILGALYLRSGKFGPAREASLRSIEIADSLRNETSEVFLYSQAVAHDNLGNVALWEGDVNRALENLRISNKYYKALEETFKDRYKSSTSKSLLGIGFVYYSTGDYGQALQFYSQALAVAQAGNNLELVLAAVNALGVLYLDQGDYPKAIEFLNQGLVAAQKTGDSLYVLNALHNLALADQRQGKYQDAATKFREVLALAEKGQRQDLLVPQLEGLGSAYHKLGQYDLALGYYDRGLEIANRLGDKTRQCELTWWKGGAYYDLGNYDKSVECSVRASLIAEQISEPNLSYLALTQLGKARLALGQYDTARAALQRAIQRAEQIRGRIAGQQQESAFFFERKIEPYYLMVDLLLREKDTPGALALAEQAKARVLLDILRTSKEDIGTVMTIAERAREAELSASVASLNKQIYAQRLSQQPDSQLLAETSRKLEKARLEYDSFRDGLYAAHPEFRLRKADDLRFDLHHLSDLGPSDDTVLVEFNVTDDKTTVFVVKSARANSLKETSASPVSTYTVDVTRKDLVEQVGAFSERLGNPHIGKDAMARKLYDLLLGPAKDRLAGCTSIAIVPDGALWDLPFQALKQDNSRYLVEDYSIFYAPSLTVLGEMVKKTQLAPEGAPGLAAGESNPSLLALGNPALSAQVAQHASAVHRGAALAPLPDAEREVNALRALYGPERARIYTGSDAREDRAKLEMGQYQVLHFATHGILDSVSPMYSHIVLSTDDKSADDGLLEAWEIMRLDLKADLAVLSACDTARGKTEAGEGVIGMSWAFFVAGCPTTVVSQWKVDSASTADLMIEFHKNLVQKTKGPQPRWKKAEALRKAMVMLMKDPKYRDPYYWAAFAVVGAG